MYPSCHSPLLIDRRNGEDRHRETAEASVLFSGGLSRGGKKIEQGWLKPHYSDRLYTNKCIIREIL